MAVSLFRFAPGKDLAIALGVATLSVATSAPMNATHTHVLRLILLFVWKYRPS